MERISRDEVFSEIVKAGVKYGLPQSCIAVQGNRIISSGVSDGEVVVSAVADLCVNLKFITVDLIGSTLYTSYCPNPVEAQLIRDRGLARVVVVDAKIDPNIKTMLEDYGLTVEKGQ